MLLAAVVMAGIGAWLFSRSPPPAPPVAPLEAASVPVLPAPPPPPPSTAPAPAPPSQTKEGCQGSPRFAGAAGANAASVQTLGWAPFGRPEVGWETYALIIAQEIGSQCAPGDPAFAEALSRWQTGQGVPADGILKPADFEIMRVATHRRRPFVAAFAQGCPPAPDPALLAPARSDEGYAGKAVTLRRDVLEAYRRMVAAAREEQPSIAGEPRLLTIVSAYRSPEEEARRCAGQDCSGSARALCSAHRTGTALDLFVGYEPASTDDANRLAQSRAPSYRWLVANAARFGFAPYVFEPWHWEWAGP